MTQNQIDVDFSLDQRVDIFVFDLFINAVEFFADEIRQSRRKLQTKQIEQSENEIGISGGVGGMLKNR